MIDSPRGRSRSRSISRYSTASSDFGNSPVRGRPMSPSPTGFFLHIRKLTRNVNEAHIREIFGTYGEIKALSYPTHPITGYPNGNATIEYGSEESVIEALRCMDGGQIDGNFIICKRVASLEAPKNFQRNDGNFKRSPPRYNRKDRRDTYVPGSRRRSRSPIRRRSLDRGRNYRRSRSPARRYSRSPIRRPIGRSPARRQSPSYSRSPVRRRSPSYSRSPVRRPIGRSRSPPPPPLRMARSRSPRRGYSYRSRSPVRRRSPSHSRSPPRHGRFDSPSPVRGRYSNRSHSRTP